MRISNRVQSIVHPKSEVTLRLRKQYHRIAIRSLTHVNEVGAQSRRIVSNLLFVFVHIYIHPQCAIQIAALFSLTARINHSCDPCAELRGGEFIDCHVDLIAKRDICKGEEIRISYINLGKTAGRAATDRNKRRRELKARYLFDCDCNKCMEG